MSTAGFNSQNGTGTGQTYTNGPSQNPVALQQLPGVSYGMSHQSAYNPMQAKAPSGPGQYPSGPYQPVPPLNSYQPGPPPSSYPSAAGRPLLSAPPAGGPPTHTPPQSASPSPGPRLLPAQATPPPPSVSSSSYHQNPQQPGPLAWQYNTTAPPMGQPPPSVSMAPQVPVANHAHPPASLAGPPASSSAYGTAAPPRVSQSITQPSGPGMPPTSLHGYSHTGVAPPPMNPMSPHTYQANRPAYGPPLAGPPPAGPPPNIRPTLPPTAPPVGSATPPPPKGDAQCGGGVNSTLSPTESDCQEGDIECPGGPNLS